MSKRFKPVIPEYVKYMKDDACFSVKDLMEMFGFKNYHSIHDLVDRGNFPKHDVEHKKMKRDQIVYNWKKATVMNYIKETWGDL